MALPPCCTPWRAPTPCSAIADVTLDDTAVYLTAACSDATRHIPGTIVRVGKDGSGARTIYTTSTGLPSGIAFTGGALYWMDLTFGGALHRVGIDGKGTATLTSFTRAVGTPLVAWPAGVAWAARNGDILHGKLSGAGPDTRRAGRVGHGAGGGRHVRVLVQRLGVRRAAPDGSGLETLAGGLGAFAGLAVDGTAAYMSDGVRDTIERVDLSGPGRVVLAAGGTIFVRPRSVAVDGNGVYWSADGGIWMAPK